MINRRAPVKQPTTMRVTVLVVLLLAAPVAALAQESTPRTVVAFVGAESASTNQHFLDAFRQGMREHGYVDGQNLTVEARWAEGRSERFSDLMEELVRRKTKVIVTVSQPGAWAAKNVTTVTPIVFIAGDPLGSGLVPSLARPGGKLTGLSISLGDDFSGKWLELLKETVPKLARVAVLWNPANPANAAYLAVLQPVAQKLGGETPVGGSTRPRRIRHRLRIDERRARSRTRRGHRPTHRPLPRADRRACDEASTTGCLWVPRVCRCRGADGLRGECRGPLSPRR